MLDYQFYDANDQLLDSTGIHATVDQVQATLPVNVTKELKLVVDFIESPGARASNLNYTIEPETITVCGDAEKLRDVDSITLTSFDLTKLSSATLYNYTIPLPEGCENLSGVTTATFRASFKDRTSATLTTSNFSLRNLPEGKDVSMLTEKLTVTVFGTSEDVASLTGHRGSGRFRFCCRRLHRSRYCAGEKRCGCGRLRYLSGPGDHPGQRLR